MDNSNAAYIEMHLDRLSDDLISETYGKQEEDELQKKKKKPKIEIDNPGEPPANV